MKSLCLFIPLLLLLAGSGWAGDQPKQMTVEEIWADQLAKPEVSLEGRPCLMRGPLNNPGDADVFDCFLPHAKGSLLVHVKSHPDPCLAQLEAAMKSMEPYLPYVHNGKVLDPVELSKVVTQLYEAGQQWEAVKRDCWRTP